MYGESEGLSAKMFTRGGEPLNRVSLSAIATCEIPGAARPIRPLSEFEVALDPGAETSGKVSQP